METSIKKNVPENNTEETNGFWHGGWGFVIFFVGLIAIMIALSYLVKYFI